MQANENANAKFGAYKSPLLVNQSPSVSCTCCRKCNCGAGHKPDRKGGKLDGKRLRLIEFIDSKQKQFGSNQSESCDTVRVISESCDTVRVTSES